MLYSLIHEIWGTAVSIMDLSVNSRVSNQPWIGLSQLHTPGTFRWVTGQTLTYNGWSSPPTSYTSLQCAYATTAGGFRESGCNTARAYVCQTKPKEGNAYLVQKRYYVLI